MKKSQEPEPEPLVKKSGAGAEPEPEPEPLKNLLAPQPCKKIKSIRKLYLSYSSLGKILSFIVKKNNYFAKELEPEPLEKNQEPEPEP